MSEMKIVAEAGACNGDVGYAINAASLAAAAGAWGFKVQIYTADSLTTKWAERYDRLPSSSATQHEQFSKVCAPEDWADVKDACDDLGIEFFASCFNEQAVDLCMNLDVEWFKIASGEITNTPLLRYTGSTGERIIMSTGASFKHEVDKALGDLTFHNTALNASTVTLLACTLEYPATDGMMYRIRQLQDIYPTNNVGYSDHTYGTESTYLSVALGAVMHEKHFTTTPGEGGDHDLGVTPAGLHEMSLIANRAEAMMWVVDPEVFEPSPEESDARRGARRGVYYARDMKVGDRFGHGDVDFLRPNYAGIKPSGAIAKYGGSMVADVKQGSAFVPGDVQPH